MNAATAGAFEKYCDSLNLEYLTREQEWDDAIDLLEENYAEIQAKLLEKQEQIQKELDKISATRAAAIKAQLKEEEEARKEAERKAKEPLKL